MITKSALGLHEAQEYKWRHVMAPSPCLSGGFFLVKIRGACQISELQVKHFSFVYSCLHSTHFSVCPKISFEVYYSHSKKGHMVGLAWCLIFPVPPNYSIFWLTCLLWTFAFYCLAEFLEISNSLYFNMTLIPLVHKWIKGTRHCYSALK